MTPLTVTHRQQVLTLLAQKVPQRTIAQQLGMHRRSVERIAMTRGHKTPDTKAKRIIALRQDGRSRKEIARAVKCSLGVVDRVVAEYCEHGPRVVKPYRCEGCEAVGVYWVTYYKPCVRCKAREGK